MAKIALKKASTDVTVYLFIQDSSKTTGDGLTGLTFETASLVASYVRPLAARAALTLATQTVTGAHSDGGFVEVDATNMPGLYRLDLSDAVCATGVNSVVVMLKGATNMAPVVLEIQLTDFDLNTAAITAAGVADAVWDEATADHTTGTTFGALDVNVDAILADTGTDGVLLSSGTGAKQISLSSGAVLLQATQTGVTIPTVTTVGTTTNLTNLPAVTTDWLTAAGVKADAVTKIQTGLATPTNITSASGVTLAATQTGVTIPTVTSITNGVTLADDAITSAKFDESTAFPVKSADTGATQIARVGADSDTLETLSDQIDGISAGDIADAVWDEALSGHTTGTTFGGKNQKAVPSETINDYKADVSALATSAELTAMKGAGWVNESLTGIQATLDSQVLNNQTIMDGKLDVIDGIVDDILVDTGTTLPVAIVNASAGSGATAKTYTVTDGTNPISGVHVWVTTDLSGTNIVASGYTDDIGEVVFYLDSGTTYYIWRQKRGYVFTNPDVEVA